MTAHDNFNQGIEAAAEQHGVDLPKYYRERNTPAPVQPYVPPEDVESVCVIEYAGEVAGKLVKPVAKLGVFAGVVVSVVVVIAEGVAFVVANWYWFAGALLVWCVVSERKRGGDASRSHAGNNQPNSGRAINVTVNVSGGSITTTTAK